MCYALASVYGSNDFDSVYSRDSDYWETNGLASPTAPYQSPHQVVLQTPQEVDYGLQSTCQQDRQYEQDVGWNSSNYYTSYYWARYFDGNRPVPCSSVGPFDRLPHYRRDWWYRGLFKEGLTGAYERVGLSFFLGLIPVIGSIVCLFLSYVYVARPLSKARLRPTELLNFKVAMWKLLAVDFFMGLIFPIGPFFRAWFHCNMRIIHFAFDAKNEQEAHIDYLYYQNNGRIRVADLDKGHAFDALQMYQQYHQDCIHTLHGADLMYAVDHAILHEDLARLQCELNQARTCQIRMENERIKSCNAAQPLIKRTLSNPEAPRCYNAILPRTAWSDQGAGVGPPVFHGPKAVHNQQSVPQQEPPTVQLAAGPQEQVSDAFQPIPAPLLSVSSQPILAPQEPVAFRPVAAPPPPIARLPTNAPRQVFAPPAIPPLQAFASDQPVASHQLTSLPQAEPHRRNAFAPRQAAIPRRIPIYQPMPPRRQALVLYDNAPLQYVLQPWQLTAAPRQTSSRPAFVQKRTMNPRQGDLIAQKSVAPPMPAIETPIVYHQAIAAQQALSSLRERSSQGTAIPHQPLVLEQVVPEQTVVPEQIDSLEETVIARPSVALKQAIIDEHTVAPEQIVAPIDPTAGAALALVTASPMGCAVATSVRSDSIVVEAAVLSTSTIQTYIALMKQRVVQVNLSSVAPTSVVAPTSMRRKRSSAPLMLRNFGIDPPLVFATVNVSNPISTGETVPAALIQEESFSSRPIVVADQSLPSEQRNLQTRDTYCLSPIVVDISNSLPPLVDNDGLRNAQAVLPENNAQLSDDTGAREQYIVTDDPACLQIPPSQESEVTATEPEEQAIWEVQNDSEDVYGDDEADDGSSYESSDESSDGSSDESSGNDSEDDGEYDGEYDGRDGDKEKEEDESGDDSGGDEYDDEDDDGDDEDDDSDDEDDSGDDDGDDEFKDDPTSEEDDHIESDKEDHYQTLMRNFNIATSLNKANNRSMSSLSTLLALESSEFSESSLASRRYSGHQHCYGPSPGAISTPIFFGIRNSNGGETPALGVNAEYNAELGMETPPGVYYPQVSHSDSETSLLAKEIEKVMSTRWELEKRSVPQRLNAELCVDTD